MNMKTERERESEQKKQTNERTNEQQKYKVFMSSLLVNNINVQLLLFNKVIRCLLLGPSRIVVAV